MPLPSFSWGNDECIPHTDSVLPYILVVTGNKAVRHTDRLRARCIGHALVVEKLLGLLRWVRLVHRRDRSRILHRLLLGCSSLLLQLLIQLHGSGELVLQVGDVPLVLLNMLYKVSIILP